MLPFRHRMLDHVWVPFCGSDIHALSTQRPSKICTRGEWQQAELLTLDAMKNVTIGGRLTRP